MSVMRFIPYREFPMVSSLFSDFLSSTPTFLSERRRSLLEGEWLPRIDVAETEENVIVTAEIPGVKQDDVTITVTDDILTIKGEKKEEKEIKREDYCSIERSYGSFMRSITLPSSVQADKAKATHKDGVLTVTIPKSESAKPKSIKVNVES
jgi:HSP20 family protein